MKKFIISTLLGLLISTSVLARSTGCKEGNCDNGYGKWVYTDKTTYEGEWVGTKKHGKGIELGQMDTSTQVSSKIVYGVGKEF